MLERKEESEAELFFSSSHISPKSQQNFLFNGRLLERGIVMEVPLLPCKVVSVSKTSKTAFVYLVEVLNFVCIDKVDKVSQKRINLAKSVN